MHPSGLPCGFNGVFGRFLAGLWFLALCLARGKFGSGVAKMSSRTAPTGPEGELLSDEDVFEGQILKAPSKLCSFPFLPKAS